MAEAAAAFEPPSSPGPLPYPSAGKIIGQPLPRLDTPEKVDGSATYGIDVQVPGMLHAAIRHSPVFGGTLKDYDDTAAMQRTGVAAVVPVFNDAVAVIADTTWTAQRALSDLEITWDTPPGEAFSSTGAVRAYATLFDDAGSNVLIEDDSFAGAMAGAATTVEAVYESPYLAHVCMEPMGCTALYVNSATDDPEDAHITVWAPSQSTTMASWNAGRIAGVKSGNVQIHATLMGGGFGRRSDMDFVRQATAIAMHRPGTPIKLTWSREEDVQHDTYRPATAARFRAGLDDTGAMTALDFVIVGKPVSAGFNERNMDFMGHCQTKVGELTKI